MSTPVAIVKGDDTQKNVEKALALIDIKNGLKMNNFLRRLFNKPAKYIDGMKLTKKSKILIKPNFARIPLKSPYAYAKHGYELTIKSPDKGGGRGTGVGDWTTPEALRGVLKSFYELGYINLVVGEAAGGCQTYLNYEYFDIYNLAKEFGAEVVDLNWEDAVQIDVPNRFTLDSIWVPRTVFESDLIVSVQPMKHSLCLKNVAMGTLPGKYYGWNRAGSWIQGTAKGIHDLHRSSKFGLSGEIVDVCSVNRIGLAVIDGTYVLDGQYTTHEANMAIAGFDPVATDSVAYRIMGFDPKRYLHMRLAVKKRLGTFDLSKIEIKGEPIEKVKLKGIAKPTSASPRARAGQD